MSTGKKTFLFHEHLARRSVSALRRGREGFDTEMRSVPLFVLPSFRAIVALVFCACMLAAQACRAESKPYLLHLPGIGGHMRIDDNVTRGMQLGGVDADISIYNWTNNDPGLPALTNLKRNLLEAQRIADQVAAIYQANPNRRIIITSHSGGGAMTVFMLERLPEDVKVDTLLMLAPALSPQYDLSKALKHVTGKVWVFSSLLDPIDGIGTRTFGTMDRVFADAAGNVGFQKPVSPADEKQYDKLISIPYNDAWTRFGNAGDHIGAMTGSFARNMLAPVLLTGKLPEFKPASQPTSAPSVEVLPLRQMISPSAPSPE